jgi:hypothetical protein
MAIAHHTVAERWAQQAVTNEPETRSMSGTNVSASGDAIQSYGWWEMARIMRKANGKAAFFLVNGDRYSPSTSTHQSNVRGAIRSTGLPSLIVPYTALDAAGIVKSSIVPLDIQEDTWTAHERTANDPDPYWTHVHGDTYSRYNGRTGEREEITRGLDGKFTWLEYRHWLGESTFKAKVVETIVRPATSEEIDAYVARRDWGRDWTSSGLSYDEWIARHGEAPEPPANTVTERLNLAEDDPRRYTVSERRERTAKFLSAFDHNERREVYFLCELPRTSATTVEEAFEALKPKEVASAIAAGLAVERQGDIFAIPTSLTTRELKSRGNGVIRKRGNLLGTNHVATEVIYTEDGDTYARGILYHAPGAWRQPDHARRAMGDRKTWHRIVKNTVPAARTMYAGGGTSGTTANQSGNSRAWTMGGNVD